jgi:hypothetical protein
MDLEMATTVSVARKLQPAGSLRGSHGVSRKTAGAVLPLFFTLNIPVFTGGPKVDVAR